MPFSYLAYVWTFLNLKSVFGIKHSFVIIISLFFSMFPEYSVIYFTFFSVNYYLYFFLMRFLKDMIRNHVRKKIVFIIFKRSIKFHKSSSQIWTNSNYTFHTCGFLEFAAYPIRWSVKTRNRNERFICETRIKCT